MALAGGSIPADVLIARLALPGWRSKQDTGQRTSLPVADQRLEVFPDRSTMTEVMVAVQQGRKQGALGRQRWVADFQHAQGQQLRERHVEGVLRREQATLGKQAGLDHGF